MCEKCNGSGRYYSSPIPGMYSLEICSCSQYTQNGTSLEQQLAELDARIEQFERENGI